MPPTIRENILSNLKTVLETITTGNGYENTIARVMRWDQRGNSLKDTPCITIAMASEVKEPSPNPLFRCNMTVLLDVWVCQTRQEAQSTDELLCSLLGDVEKCLMQDHTRGGFAIDTDLKGSQPFEGVEGSGYAGIVVEMEIFYEHNQLDPAAGT